MYKNEVNCETGEIQLVAYTDEEIAEREAIAAEIKLREQAAAQAEAEAAVKKAAAEAKLAALGLTADDLKALGLGGN